MIYYLYVILAVSVVYVSMQIVINDLKKDIRWLEKENERLKDILHQYEQKLMRRE